MARPSTATTDRFAFEQALPHQTVQTLASRGIGDGKFLRQLTCRNRIPLPEQVEYCPVCLFFFLG